MYTDFYGLRERPFALLPDPRFLFLSRSHREALAHLLYGIEAGEGFIQVVGQVGTGKTTLCRTLLGRIGPDVEIAYIFNPSPNETELLSAINREFGLPTTARTRTELIDQLNEFLLEKRGRDRRVLLVIDEAQNLEPAVLEQIRLLSNLETEHEKLLQIALVGQPELDENLARTDLRQLRQRITVRWDLHAFDRAEVGDYLNHRLQVAGLVRPDLFTRGAVNALFRRSRGIPRVINAIADRALLAGYSAGRRKIDGRLVRRVARELPASERGRLPYGLGLTPGAATAFVVCGLVLGFFATTWWPGALATRPAPLPAVAAAPPLGVEALAAVEPPAELERTTPFESYSPVAGNDRVALLNYLVERSSRVTAAGGLDALLDQWGHYAPVGIEVDPNEMTKAVRQIAPLRVFVTRASVAQLRHLNLPAILELEPSPTQLRYAALLALDPDGTAYLGQRDRLFTLEPGELDLLWTGRTFFLWSNFESMPALVPGMNGSAVRWLQARLTDLGYLKRGDASGDFDGYTVAAIRRFQSEHGLDDTGQVGPETLIALYQELSYQTPRLLQDADLS
jgi:general secretion pathway protein A